MREIKESSYLYEYIEDIILKQRIMHSLNWYIMKAIIYKRCYYVFSCLAIIAPLLVSILHSLDNNTFVACNLQTCSVVLATITTMSSALIALYRFKDRWKENRKAAEQLKSELMKFYMKVGIYSSGDIKLLSNNVEALITVSNLEEMKILESEKHEETEYS